MTNDRPINPPLMPLPWRPRALWRIWWDRLRLWRWDVATEQRTVWDYTSPTVDLRPGSVAWVKEHVEVR
jgi:hypothetical protein